VYRGKDIPYLTGHYIYGDFCTSRIWRLKSNECGEFKNELINNNLSAYQISTFGEDNNGELYVAGLGTGKIYKLKQACTLSAEVESIANVSCAEASNGKVKFKVNSKTPYTYQITGPSSDLDHLKSGKYSYKIIDSLGCTVSNCFEVGIDTTKLICNVMSMAEVFLCKKIEVLIPNLCEQFEIDSFQIFLNGMWYATTNSLQLTLSDDGSYSFTHFKDGCAYETQNLVNIKIDTTTAVPQFTYNGTVAKVTGPYVLFQIFKDGVFVSQNSSGLFDVDPIDYGKYTFVGITANGCTSPSSDPLIISSIESTTLDKTLIFPNPFNDVLYLKPNDVKSFSCYSLDGQKIFYLDKPHESISTETLQSGVYLMKIVQANKETWTRMIKE
jgi:Secretion system C-terminal sorting domain